jgi:hypothetical protein
MAGDAGEAGKNRNPLGWNARPLRNGRRLNFQQSRKFGRTAEGFQRFQERGFVCHALRMQIICTHRKPFLGGLHLHGAQAICTPN